MKTITLEYPDLIFYAKEYWFISIPLAIILMILIIKYGQPTRS